MMRNVHGNGIEQISIPSPLQIFYNTVNLLLSCFFILQNDGCWSILHQASGREQRFKTRKKMYLFFGNILIW